MLILILHSNILSQLVLNGIVDQSFLLQQYPQLQTNVWCVDPKEIRVFVFEKISRRSKCNKLEINFISIGPRLRWSGYALLGDALDKRTCFTKPPTLEPSRIVSNIFITITVFSIFVFAAMYSFRFNSTKIRNRRLPSVVVDITGDGDNNEEFVVEGVSRETKQTRVRHWWVVVGGVCHVTFCHEKKKKTEKLLTMIETFLATTTYYTPLIWYPMFW